MAKIAVIDDDENLLMLMRTYLSRAGHKVLLLQRATKALEELEREQPDLVICDIMMPGITGGAVYKGLRDLFGPTYPIIICSASRVKVKTANDPFALQIAKPVDYDELNRVIERLLAPPPVADHGGDATPQLD